MLGYCHKYFNLKGSTSEQCRPGLSAQAVIIIAGHIYHVISDVCCSLPFQRKVRGTLFSAFLGGWFRVHSRYLVNVIPPTVLG